MTTSIILDPQNDPADLARQAGEYERALVQKQAERAIDQQLLMADIEQALKSAQHTIETTGSKLRRKNYAGALKQFNAFREADGARLDNGQIQRWSQSLIDAVKTDKRGKPELDPTTKQPIPLYKPTTINAKLVALRALLEAAALAAMIPDTKVMLRDMAKVKGVKVSDNLAQKWITARRYTPGEMLDHLERIETAIDAGDMARLQGMRLRALVALAFGTGARITELASLTIGNTLRRLQKDEATGAPIPIVWIEAGAKFGKPRAVPLRDDVRRYVVEWLTAAGIDARAEADTPLFRAFYKGGRVRKAKASARTLQSELETLGIEAHDLRRSFARACVEAGMSYTQVQILLGHSSVTTTERYIGRFSLTADHMPRFVLHR